MALKGMESWDIYATVDIDDYWQVANTSTITAGGRCSSNALFNNTVGGQGPVMGVSTTQTGGFVAGAHKPGVLAEVVLQILNITGGIILFATANIDGSLSWWTGPNTTLGSVIGTTPSNLVHVGRYDHLGFDFSINGVSSYAKISVNGVLQLNFSGSFPFGAFSPSDKQWRAFQLVHPSGGYWDDNYWGDLDTSDPLNTYTSVSQLGDIRVEGQLCLTDAVGGGGTYREFTCSAGADHGALIDDNPPDDDATYVQTTVIGNRETAKFPAIAIAAGNIYAVQNMPNVKKTDPGTRSIADLLLEGGTLTADVNQQPSQTDYLYFPKLWAKNPRTSASFTVAQINASEHGIKVSA